MSSLYRFSTVAVPLERPSDVNRLVRLCEEENDRWEAAQDAMKP